MRHPYRRRSYSAWVFWSALLVGGTLYGAFHFDWFPIAFLPRAKTPHEDQNSKPVADGPPAPMSLTGQVEVADNPVAQQTEPPPTEIEEPLSGQGAPESRSTRARLLEQRAESSSPRLRANSAAPAFVEQAKLDASDVSRPAFGTMQTVTSESQAGRIELPNAEPEPRSGRVVHTSNVVDGPASDTIDPALAAQLEKVDRWLQAEDSQPSTLLRAHRELSTIYWTKPPWRRHIQKRIDRTARAIYFEPQTHFLQPYVVRANDQWAQFARQYQVPWQYLAKLNHVEPKKLRTGQQLKVIKGPFSAIIELDGFLLTVHAYGYYVKAYPIGLGKDATVPQGKFSVAQKLTNPQYTDSEGRVIEGGDLRNPLGERWIDLGSSYGIHGTTDPDSIGKHESRGCVRMRNEDVVEVYDMLAVGSEVTIRR